MENKKATSQTEYRARLADDLQTVIGKAQGFSLVDESEHHYAALRRFPQSHYIK
jgi:hypothetical protein